jgi:hypothetical protein
MSQIERTEWDDVSRTVKTYDAGGTLTSSRPYTTEENAAADAAALTATATSNDAALREKARTAIQGNKDFLAIASPTNAQTLAQVKALTRQNNALIPLVLGVTATTDVTAASSPA